MPPGATCELFGSTVTGNVEVQTNATIAMWGPTIDGNLRIGTGASLVSNPDPPVLLTVDGNIVADQCSNLVMAPVKVGGNVDIQNCAPGNRFPPNLFYEIIVVNAQISGNFDCSNNSIDCRLANSSLKGNVLINDNKVETLPSAEVDGNTIGGNLQCSGNSPAPVGGGNTVGGQKRGQCAGF